MVSRYSRSGPEQPVPEQHEPELLRLRFQRDDGRAFHVVRRRDELRQPFVVERERRLGHRLIDLTQVLRNFVRALDQSDQMVRVRVHHRVAREAETLVSHRGERLVAHRDHVAGDELIARREKIPRDEQRRCLDARRREGREDVRHAGGLLHRHLVGGRIPRGNFGVLRRRRGQSPPSWS